MYSSEDVGDVDGDGQQEIIVTYLKPDGLYASQVYDVSCSSKCQIILQPLDYSLLSNMIAVPFLVDVDGSGTISIFTFTAGGRSVLTYNRTATSLSL